MSVAHPYPENGKRLSKVGKTLHAEREEVTLGWPVVTRPTVAVINRAGSSSATNLHF